jgi:hypothetical protein
MVSQRTGSLYGGLALTGCHRSFAHGTGYYHVGFRLGAPPHLWVTAALPFNRMRTYRRQPLPNRVTSELPRRRRWQLPPNCSISSATTHRRTPSKSANASLRISSAPIAISATPTADSHTDCALHHPPIAGCFRPISPKPISLVCLLPFAPIVICRKSAKKMLRDEGSCTYFWSCTTVYRPAAWRLPSTYSSNDGRGLISGASSLADSSVVRTSAGSSLNNSPLDGSGS